MIHELTYVNSLGKSFTFGGESSWHFGETDIFNLSLEYSTLGNKITSFDTTTREFALRAFTRYGSLEERNELVDIVSYDTYVCTPGKLYAGDSYLECYIYGFDSDWWQLGDDNFAVDLKIISDSPAWIREHTISLMAGEVSTTGGLDYPHDYPHNFQVPAGSSAVVKNPFMLPAKVDIAFSGPCSSPYVIIGGNRYQVDATANRDELILVKGFGQKSITLREVDGDTKNIFSYGHREQGANIFAEIPPGINYASWPSSYNIELTLYEERRVPWWT